VLLTGDSRGAVKRNDTIEAIVLAASELPVATRGFESKYLKCSRNSPSSSSERCTPDTDGASDIAHGNAQICEDVYNGWIGSGTEV
jgi:hypothetical protein